MKLLKELKLQKAPGPDSITATILKTCAEQVAPLLQLIFQKSLDTGELPLDWQKANVVVVVVVDPTPPTCCQQSPAPESCGSQQSLPPGGKERLHFVGIRPEVQARKGGW